MEFNRNQFMLAGVLVLLLGFQFRTFESFTLNEKTTKFVATRLGGEPAPTTTLVAVAPARKVVRPPTWLGWSLMSVGSVLILHSLAMKKPGGG
jgi:hypothetical protein